MNLHPGCSHYVNRTNEFQTERPAFVSQTCPSRKICFITFLSTPAVATPFPCFPPCSCPPRVSLCAQRRALQILSNGDLQCLSISCESLYTCTQHVCATDVCFETPQKRLIIQSHEKVLFLIRNPRCLPSQPRTPSPALPPTYRATPALAQHEGGEK